VIEFGFNQWNLHRIEATYFSRNPASGRVMKKLGMVQEGILRDHILKWNRYEDLVVHGIVNPAHGVA
jgi:RimJ/RimL family protein N-acetyltransferase